jgi:osmoprotectant transport system ATP-binding protein
VTASAADAGTDIAFRAVTFGYDGRDVVGPVDLDVERGETVVLLGESGSGKTTLLRLVNALAHPRTGTVTVLGRATTAWDPVRLRRSTGYVIQDVGLFPHLSVRANVELVPKLEGWTPARREERARELLALVGLDPDDVGARRPHQLSGGQRQRVGVARALAHDPGVLLCDEPFGAVDPMTRRSLQDEFAALTGRLAKTVLFVTHDVGEARRLADRVVVLHRGRIQFTGSVKAFERSEDDVVRALRGSA